MQKFNPATVKVALVTDSESAHDFIEWIKNVPDQLLGLDVETADLNWMDDELRLVQFGTGTEGWAIPFQEWRHLVTEALYICNARGKFFVGHNIKFDLHYLERNTGWFPTDWRFIHDTMPLCAVFNSSAANGLKDLAEAYVWSGAKIGEEQLKADKKRMGWTWATVPVNLPSYWIYGVLDTIMTWHLFWIMKAKCEVAGCMEAYGVEMAAYPVWYAMEKKGMLLDREHCISEDAKLMSRAETIEAEVAEYGINNIGSTNQLVLAFERAGIELTETTPTGKWKMDADTFDLIAATNNHPLLNMVKEYRSCIKYSSTYYRNFMSSQRSDGRCHPFYWPVGARTGRTSATEPAILTVPRPDDDKSDAAKQVRNAFVAGDGNVYVSTDFSNIEARIFAHFADEKDMKQAFADGLNLHKFTASKIYHRDYDSIDKGEGIYTLAKNTLFCKLFGGGVGQIAITAGVSFEEADEANTGLNVAFPGMKAFQKHMSRVATDNLNAHGQAFIRGVDGRILAMKETDERYYAFTNWLIQGTACTVLKKRLAAIHNMGLTEYMVAAIHDEVIGEIPKDCVNDYREAITNAMQDDQMFSVPIIVATGEPNVRWGLCK